MATPTTAPKTEDKAPAPSKAPAKTEEKEKKEGEVVGLGLDEVTGTLKLISKDKKEFEVERKNAFISTLVKTSLDTDAAATEVPIPGVHSAILAEVLTYMNHHKGVEPPIVEKPLRSKVMKDVCKDPFDAEFIDRIGENRQALYDLILAANYMDIKSLLHLGCAKVASLIKGQPLEKIKDILSTGKPTEGTDKKEEKKAETAPAKTEAPKEAAKKP